MYRRSILKLPSKRKTYVKVLNAGDASGNQAIDDTTGSLPILVLRSVSATAADGVSGFSVEISFTSSTNVTLLRQTADGAVKVVFDVIYLQPSLAYFAQAISLSVGGTIATTQAIAGEPVIFPNGGRLGTGARFGYLDVTNPNLISFVDGVAGSGPCHMSGTLVDFK